MFYNSQGAPLRDVGGSEVGTGNIQNACGMLAGRRWKGPAATVQSCGM